MALDSGVRSGGDAWRIRHQHPPAAIHPHLLSLLHLRVGPPPRIRPQSLHWLLNAAARDPDVSEELREYLRTRNDVARDERALLTAQPTPVEKPTAQSP